MKGKIALALATLLALPIVLAMPIYLQDTTVEAVYPPYHWKIELAQKKANARIEGWLLDAAKNPIPCTKFDLTCICEEVEPQTNQRVYTKVKTDIIPTWIRFTKYIDWNKDGIWDVVEPVEEPVADGYQHEEQYLLQLSYTPPLTIPGEVCTEIFPNPGQTWRLDSWHDSGFPVGTVNSSDQVDLTPIAPPGPLTWWHVVAHAPPTLTLDKMVVVEVHQQPYDAKDPYFDWMLLVKQHDANVHWWGDLTYNGTYISGTHFDILCNCTILQVADVTTPWCTVPNDIEYELWIDWGKDGTWDRQDPWTKYWIPPAPAAAPQFPWIMFIPGPAQGQNVTLELTEVQEYTYWVMGGWLNSAGRLGSNPPWSLDGWASPTADGVPFASRAPYPMPMVEKEDIKFLQKDPITGIVEFYVLPETYTGLDHTWYSEDVGTWFRARITIEDAGCGWIFTGEGKEPILGSVDLRTYNNLTGVYTFGPNHIGPDADDELLAGQVSPGESAGAGPPIGACLQLLRGADGIPGTGDDPIGRGDPDGPNLRGSSIMYLPGTMDVTYWSDVKKTWLPLFYSPWPMLLTTGTASDIVIDFTGLSLINGANSTRTGQRWEFFTGAEHPPAVHWKDPKCNAYVTYVGVWSVLYTSSPLGTVEVLFEMEEKKVREDLMIADLNCDEVCNIIDIVIAALAFDEEDEWIGTDGIPQVGHSSGPDGIWRTPDDIIYGDDKPVADRGYDARGDIRPKYGVVNIVDIVRIALDFDKTLDP